MRLDKYLSMAGHTRSAARDAAKAGRITVNGRVVRDNGAAVSETDSICLDGVLVSCKSELYFMVNKPAGMLTATEDAHGEATVADLLPEAYRKRGPGPVGRLDKDVTGLVLLTTDGQLAHRLISPRNHIEKVYRASVEGTPTAEDAQAFRDGLPLSDFTARPAELIVLKPGDTCECEIRVTEGKFHQVKRMMAAVGHPVITLRRISVAGLALDPALASGEWRELTEDEIRYLKSL